MEVSIILKLVLALLLVLLNGFFVAAEFSIVKARLSQIKTKADEGIIKAKNLIQVLDHLDPYLSATQLGITFASLALGWVAESSFHVIFTYLFHFVVVEEYFSSASIHTLSIVLSFIFVTCLHIVFGELIPKSLAIRDAESVAYFVSTPLIIFYKIFKPFILLMNGIANLFLKLCGIHSVHNQETHSTEELKILVKQSADYGAIEHDNYEIIKNALDFDDHSVKQTMIPRQNIDSIDILNSKEEIINQIIDSEYSRMPVYEESIDNILGIFYTKEVLREYIRNKNNLEALDLRSLIHDALYIVESKKVSDALQLLRDKKQMLAIVIDEFGGTEGIITFENIMEELVGDIQDETDEEEEFFVQLEENTFNVIATENLIDINEFLPQAIELNPESYNTLAGYILNKLDELPNENDEFTLDCYHMKILKMQNKSVERVQIKYIPTVEGKAEQKIEDGSDKKNTAV